MKKVKCKNCLYMDIWTWYWMGNNVEYSCKYIKGIKKYYDPYYGKCEENIAINYKIQNKNGTCKYYKYQSQDEKLKIEENKKIIKEKEEKILRYKLKKNYSFINKIFGKPKSYCEIIEEASEEARK
jgi:hypothetical protein